jgi:hypothetical protein
MWGRRLIALGVALVVGAAPLLLLGLAQRGWGGLVLGLAFALVLVSGAIAVVLIAIPALAILDRMRPRGWRTGVVLGAATGAVAGLLAPTVLGVLLGLFRLPSPGWLAIAFVPVGIVLGVMGAGVYAACAAMFVRRAGRIERSGA